MPRKAAQTTPYTLMPLACSALQVDTSIQPRLALDSQVVTKYATLYEEDEAGQTTLPPLHVFQIDGAYYVADGFHRLAAALQASRDTVPCEVYTGTRRDAMVHAVYANVRRGLDYSSDDKQQILERLLADPEIAQLGDRALAQDLSMSHMTVWRTRSRLAEEARLQAEIAVLPATATAPKVREQEQLAAYLGVDVDEVKRSLGTSPMRYESPQAMIKEIARRALRDGETPRSAVESVARNIQSVAGLHTRPPTQQRERPSMSKAAIAERKEYARREELTFQLYNAVDGLVALYPFTREEQGYAADDPDYTLPPTAEELVAAVLPKYVEDVGDRLTQARTVLDALCRAWEAQRPEPGLAAAEG
jgi:hypothetical protein